MNWIMIWSLVGAFVNVTVLTRLLNRVLKKPIPDGYKRAFLVFGVVGLLDLIGLWVLYKDLRLSLHLMLFYFVPFLVMWLLKDIFESSRKSGINTAGQNDNP